ncbi:FxSxx-COOH system tetratricopeptide repeat protein [Streptomyces sp. NBC_01321]|uniref:FxSxx-COOH system tetratricopeptide repeat protein n=1 Tax=Streptomyces sp. NBC_01321 TaxID=2903825 RepID=UPI002E128C88|nr:FxSxx-COOH system tetratricopeptide repeat protein [Streptomyces sp. NBC_01321]
MSGDEQPLLIEPVVGWLREVEPGLVHYVSVDLRGPLDARSEHDGEAWPYDEEELAFSVSLDGAPNFVCEVLDDPGVVLHRFGGTYGPARFVVTAGEVTGPAVLRLTISNQWGMPVRKAELPCHIREAASEPKTPRTVVGRLPGLSPEARTDTARPSGGSGEGEEDRAAPAHAARPSRATGQLRAFLERLTNFRAPSPPGAATAARPSVPPGPEPTQSADVANRSEDRAEASPDRSPDPQPGAGTAVTISFAGPDRAWAVWIADRLQRRGVPVALQRREPPGEALSPEVPPVELLRDLLLSPGRILLLLSDAYVRPGPDSHEQWSRALLEVVAPAPDRFAAVSLTTSALPAAAAVLYPVHLVGIGEEEAERRLLTRLDLPVDAPPERAVAGPRPRYPADIPEVWGGVPRRNTRFTGRDELLNRTHQLFVDAEPGHGRVALYGMSGVGKTQLAVEYAQRFGSDYDVVWWVPADGRSLFRQRLSELAPELGLSTGVEYGERLRAVADALRRGEPYAHWLLVLDGADDPEQIRDLVPAGSGHVLITSRHLGWGEHNSMLVEVPAYERRESVDFINRRAPRLTPAEADRLADALEDLPLLLDQTAGWLNQSGLTVDEYIELLTNGIGEDVVRVSVDFPVVFRTAWTIQLSQLLESDPEAFELLRLCAFFAPGSIPGQLLTRAQLPGSPGGDSARLRAMRQLLRHSAARLETGSWPVGDGEALQLHRLFHQLVRSGISGDDRALYRDAARDALAVSDPGDPADIGAWPLYAALTQHLEWAEALESTAPPVQQLVLNCLRYMYLSGEYGSGIRLAGPAMDSWRSLLGETHPRIWDLSHHYANLLRALGDYRTSESVERRVTVSLRAEGRESEPEHLRAVGGLAADLRGQGRYQEALTLSVSIRDRCLTLFGQEDGRTLNADNNLAVSLRLLGRYEEALALDRRTLTLRRAVLRRGAAATLYSEINCAIDLRLLGHHQEAEEELSRTVHSHLRLLGAGNPQTLRAQHGLALCRYARAGAAVALPLLIDVRERCLRVLGEHDPLTLQITASGACVEGEAGDPGQARALHEQVVAGYLRMLGPEHPYTIGTQGNTALMRWTLGDHAIASHGIEQARALMAREVGEDHPWTIGWGLNTTLVRIWTGQQEAARELGRECAARAATALGPRHPLAVACRAAYVMTPTTDDPPFQPFEPLVI